MKNIKNFLIIAAEFYPDYMDIMIDNAIELLKKEECNYSILRVPGSLELPIAISFVSVAEPNKYDGYVILGCIIDGKSDHYQYVCNEVMSGLSTISYNHCLAIGNGVITAKSKKIALERLEIYAVKAVNAAIKMANIKDSLFNKNTKTEV